MKKQHDALELANELEGSSAYFQQPKTPDRSTPPPQPVSGAEGPAVNQPSQQPRRTTDRSVDRSIEQPAVRAMQRRQTQRRAFEFYRDQLETFKSWLAVDIATGGGENMSIWAREAFDDYIAKRGTTDQPSERAPDQPIGRPAGSAEE